MEKLMPLLMLMTLFAVPACGQERWSTSIDKEGVPGGAVISVHYDAPSDSGTVHLAFISTDSSLCYDAYQVTDKFPPETCFTVQVYWRRCATNEESVSETVASASNISTLVYLGSEKKIQQRGQTHQARDESFFLVTRNASEDSSIREVKGEQDLEGLSPSTTAKLKELMEEGFDDTEGTRQ